MTTLSLAANRVTGSIPAWLGNLTNLTKLSLSQEVFYTLPEVRKRLRTPQSPLCGRAQD